MIMMYDRITVDERSVRRTSDGYLVATPRVARTGIQVYAGKEVGKPDIDKVRVYRPESEVFAPDSLKSYAHRPITINHPSQPVTSDNWRRHAVGQTGDEVVRDGAFVRVPMVLMDADAIKMFESGHRELSQGYTCDLKWGAGETLQGETYDAMQTDIRANHTAIVKDARGGRDLRIGDDLTGWSEDSNPNHDPETGRFTFSLTAQHKGGGGPRFGALTTSEKEAEELLNRMHAQYPEHYVTIEKRNTGFVYTYKKGEKFGKYHYSDSDIDDDGMDECPGCGADVAMDADECDECGYNLAVDNYTEDGDYAEDKAYPTKSGNENHDPKTGKFTFKGGGSGADITTGAQPTARTKSGLPLGYNMGGAMKGERAGKWVHHVATGWRAGPFSKNREAIREAEGHREGLLISMGVPSLKIKDPDFKFNPNTETGLGDPEDLFEASVKGKGIVKIQSKHNAGKRLVFKSEQEAIDYIRQQRKAWALAREESGELRTSVRRRGLRGLLPGPLGRERSRSNRWRIRFDSMFVDEPLIDSNVEILPPLDLGDGYDPYQPRNELGEWTHSGLSQSLARLPSPPAFESERHATGHVKSQQEKWQAEFNSIEEAKRFVIEQQKKWNSVKVRPVFIPSSGVLGLLGKKRKTSQYVISRDGIVADAVIDHIISGDSEEGETEMSKIITVDGIPVETTEVGASVVQRTLDGYQKQIDEFKLFKKKSEEELEEERKKKAADSAMIAAKDAEIVTLKKQVADSVITPQRLDQMVRDRSDIVNRATSVLKDKLTADGKTEAEIRRQVVDSHMGDMAKGYTDEQVSAAFGVITKDYKPGEQADGKPRYNANDFAFDLSRSTQRLSDGDKAWEDSNKHLSEAWKGNGAAAQ